MTGLEFDPYQDFLTIIGRKAMGKTERTKFYIRNLDRFIIIDPTWQLQQLGYEVHYPSRISDAFNKWKRVVYCPLSTRKEDYVEVFREILGLSNFTLCIDEIQEFAHSKGYLCDEFKQIVCRGRAQGIGLIGNSRRPSLFHNDIKGNADHIVCFQLQLMADRKYMEEWIGVDRDELKNLKPYNAFYYNVKTGTLTQELPLY